MRFLAFEELEELETEDEAMVVIGQGLKLIPM